MIRQLSIEDLPVVTRMVRDSFDPAIWPYMTYTQHGIGRFLEVALRHPQSVEPRYLIVAADDRTDEPVGFADFTLGGDGAGFLSYICVDPAARGKGIASALFDQFLADNRQVSEVKLDTFRNNVSARALYSRWGFAAESTSCWVTRPLPVAAEPPRLNALAVSLAAYETYGFCELNIFSPEGPVRVGLIGETVVRCFDRETFEKDAVLAGVAGAFEQRERAFAVVSESEERSIRTPHDILLLSDRMSLVVGGSRTIQ